MYSSETFIIYTLPKANSTQALNNATKIKKVWENLSLFFEKCTIEKSIVNQLGVTLTAYIAYENEKNPELANEIIEITKKKFGDGNTSIQMYSEKGYPCYKTEWKFKSDDYLKRIEEYLPFKFNRKHLRIAKLNKTKTNYSSYKLL